MLTPLGGCRKIPGGQGQAACFGMEQVIARRDDVPRLSRRIYVHAQKDRQSAQLWWPDLGVARLAGLTRSARLANRSAGPGGTDRRTDRGIA